jgi:hypothetical protein
MRETAEELDKLPALLDASLSRSTAHPRSIVAERTHWMTVYAPDVARLIGR